MSEISKIEEKLLAKLLDYLSYSSRTEKEVRTRARRILGKLATPGNTDRENLIERAISILKEENLVDDRLYAKKYIEGLILSPKNKSVKEAINFLRKKGISEDIAQNVIGEFGGDLESKSLKTLIEKKTAVYGSLRNPVARHKLIKYLVSKGIRYEDIKSEIDKIASLK